MADVQMVNRMEPVTKTMVDELMQSQKGVCNCTRCRFDIMALALNALPPQYVVTEVGEVFTNIALASTQWRADVMMAVMKAIDIVRKKPRH